MGGMINGLRLRLPDGRMVEPLATAPWIDEPNVAALPEILRSMRGEWPCIPFGTEGATTLPDGWPIAAGTNVPPHGFAANNDWTVTENSGALVAEIRYPDDSPIELLRRRLRPANAGVQLDLEVLPRRDCNLPIALHPVLTLPQASGTARLNIGPHDTVWTHPLGSEPDPCPLVVDEVSPNLNGVLCRDGTEIDLTSLPLSERAECRVLIPNASGRATLERLDENWQTVLEWNPGDFPSLMLWISNRGRQGFPWSGRHLAIGVEPCRAAFDLGATISAGPNPVARLVPTTMEFRAGMVWHTTYTISVNALTN
ncbi:hypothetical protein [Ensifer adhaerens]|uniref:hypothetical protein n=1 Tax=Ensifer adhaerens TaxID=106592 RepID=UPI0015695A7F|nr:hypothetical protein [Ensifer adhaerens]